MKTKLTLIGPALFLMLCSGGAMAGSTETWICLKNKTSDQKLILIEDIDNHDWDGFSRPDHNWNGAYVEAGQTRCERAEVNSNTAHFAFIINGTTIPHKIRMTLRHPFPGAYYWSAKAGSEPSLDLLTGYEVESSSQWYPYKCDPVVGDVCNMFIIKDVP